MPLNKRPIKKNMPCTGLMFLALLLTLLFPTLAVAEVTLELEETEITGARELPKVLYIVPWKKTGPDSRPLPMKSLMEEILAPIDMDVFRRQVRYHEFTHPAPKPALSAVEGPDTAPQ